SGVLTATTQLFLLNSIARRQRTAPSWAAAGEGVFYSGFHQYLLCWWWVIPRTVALSRPSRLHRVYYGGVRPGPAHQYFRPRVVALVPFPLASPARFSSSVGEPE